MRTATGDRVYKIGEVAKRLGVSCRTVSNWMESGKLKGYRLPRNNRVDNLPRPDGSKKPADPGDRRFLRRDVLEFLTKFNQPAEIVSHFRNHNGYLTCGLSAADQTNFTAATDDSCTHLGSLYALAVAVRRDEPAVVVLGSILGLGVCADVAGQIRADLPGTRVVLVCGPDTDPAAALRRAA